MALAIDATSPALATGNPSATTASFTPPDGSLLLIGWSGNNDGNPTDPSVPTITDNLGSHLTYTRWEWGSRDTTGAEGQVAFWTASVVAGAAMTITVTNNDPFTRHSAVKVWVLTGALLAGPVGAHGTAGSTSASAIAQSYTAQADNSQGFLVATDWNALGAQTAGTGCTLDATFTTSGQMSSGWEHRTIADGANGGLTTMNLSLPGTSTNLCWAYIEIIEGVGDAPEKDPPPVINFTAPGGLGPNGIPTPWVGTGDAAPPPTGLIIHQSSPDAVINTVGATSALTTKSFTPPANSLLLIMWAANSTGGINPSAPTITDNLGAHLTYTLRGWQSRVDSPNVDGQAAAWTAPVTSSAPMTVTVSNNAGAGEREAELQVLVLIDTSGGQPTVGATGKSGSASATIVAQTYTAQATGGQGFLTIGDWNAVGSREGTDCYPVRPGAVGTIPGIISYAQYKRTIPDDVNTVSNRLNASLLGTSNALSWVYVEVLPAAVVSAPASVQPLVVTPPFTPVAVPPVTLTASQPLGNPAVATPGPLVVSTPWASKVPGALTSSSPPTFASPQPLTVGPQFRWPYIPPVSLTASYPLGNPAVPTVSPTYVQTQPFERKLPPPVTLSASQPLGNPAVGTPGPLVVTPPFRSVPIPGALITGNLASPVVFAASPQPLVVSPPFQPVPIPGAQLSVSQPLGNPAVGTPGPLVVTPPFRPVPIPGALITGSVSAPVLFTVSPQPLVVGPPSTVAPVPGVRLFAAPGAAVAVTTSTPQPLVVGPTFTLAPVPGARVFAAPSTVAAPAALVVTPPLRPVPIPGALITYSRPLGNPAVGSPKPLVVTPPWRPVLMPKAYVLKAPFVVEDCDTHRPNIGTTVRPGGGVTLYDRTTTARPGSGITVRPDIGDTEPRCE